MFDLLSPTTRRQFNSLAAVGAASLAMPGAADAADDKQTFTYKTVDGLEIQADVYNAAPTPRRPAVIWIHGGALIVGHRSGVMARFHQRLLAADWTVISIDYRLAPETRLPAILEDVRDAYRWVLLLRGPPSTTI